ncbi:MAG TPA: CPBP family intramembrane metalloprotease [Firmicutes bacterium]|nr:CPBP family intramembrane metalloprotease [Bacillota bacterium]
MQPEEGQYSSVWDVVTILVLSLVIVPALAHLSCRTLLSAATNLPVDKVKQISMAVSMTAQEAALFLLPWGVVWSVGRGLRDIGLVWRRPLKDVLVGIALGIICLFVSLLSEQVSAAALGLFLDNDVVTQMMSRENELMVNALRSGYSPWLRVYMWVLVGLIAPIAEETLFRGYVLGVFTQRWGEAKSLLLANLLFAVVHGYVVHFLQVFLVGLLLGLAYQRRKTLLTPIIAHGVMNLMVAAAVAVS